MSTGSSPRRHPPAVQYPVRRSRILGLLLCALAASGMAAVSGWAFFGAGPQPGWRVWCAMALACAAGAGALHFWMGQFVGVLRWDGQGWSLEFPAAEPAGLALASPPQVFLDLQSHIWMHAVPVGRGPVWLWLERSAHPERWGDLRRAVYSRARSGVDNNDATAPAPHRGRES